MSTITPHGIRLKASACCPGDMSNNTSEMIMAANPTSNLSLELNRNAERIRSPIPTIVAI